LHEQVGIRKGQATAGRLAPDGEIGWQKGSHRRLKRTGWPNYTFAFHDNEEIGPELLARIAKQTGLTPEDL
jgi:hypothetical protein